MIRKITPSDQLRTAIIQLLRNDGPESFARELVPKAFISAVVGLASRSIAAAKPGLTCNIAGAVELRRPPSHTRNEKGTRNFAEAANQMRKRTLARSFRKAKV